MDKKKTGNRNEEVYNYQCVRATDHDVKLIIKMFNSTLKLYYGL